MNKNTRNKLNSSLNFDGGKHISDYFKIYDSNSK